VVSVFVKRSNFILKNLNFKAIAQCPQRFFIRLHFQDSGSNLLNVITVISKILFQYRFFSIAAIFIAAFTACEEEHTDLGKNLLPSGDLVEVKDLVEKNSIFSYTYREDSLRTDEGTNNLLGTFDDPVFGRTSADFASQFRLQYYPDFGTNPVADSVILYLYYQKIYGDTLVPQTIKVYELETPLDVDQDYYQEVNLKAMASDQLLGEREFTPVVELDSVYGDTLAQSLKISLDPSLGEKLVNADSLEMINNDVFLEFFKGLYVETEKESNEGGALLSLLAASTDEYQGSALVVYYNNDENINADEPDTLYNAYVITEFSARVNSFTHDYSGTAFESNMNQDNSEDSLIYVQPTGGLKSKIIIDNLSSWKDSVNMAINKAELVFQVDTLASEMEKYPPPSQLLFTFIDEDGEEYLPIDYSFSPDFYGGALNREDYTYRFNITQHIQQIIDGEVDNYGFFLTSAWKNSQANRVVLKGSGSKTGIKMVVSYSKFVQ
jgi:hypothetical protein